MSGLTACKWCRVGAHDRCNGADLHGLSQCPCKAMDHLPLLARASIVNDLQEIAPILRDSPTLTYFTSADANWQNAHVEHGITYVPLRRLIPRAPQPEDLKTLVMINAAQYEDERAIAETGRARPLPRRPRP